MIIFQVNNNEKYRPASQKELIFESLSFGKECAVAGIILKTREEQSSL